MRIPENPRKPRKALGTVEDHRTPVVRGKNCPDNHLPYALLDLAIVVDQKGRSWIAASIDSGTVSRNRRADGTGSVNTLAITACAVAPKYGG